MTTADRILVVDDDLTSRRLLARSLAKAGYEMREAVDGEAGLAEAGSWLPDVVLLDVGMPGRDGFQVCEALKANPATSAIPVVFLTALSGPKEVERAFAVGGSDYLTKPFHLREVKARVALQIRLRKAEQELLQAHNRLVQAKKLEAVGHLAAGIAHEINTPTQYIGDNLAFLKESFGELPALFEAYDRLVEEAAERLSDSSALALVLSAREEADTPYLLAEMPRALDQCLEGVERVSSIVRAMKDFSHPGGDTMVAVDLNRAIESTVTVCRNEWKYHAEMVLELDPELPAVTCMPGEINQVLLNMVVNAAHAIADALRDERDRKGEIRISTRSDGPHVEIRVRDTGTGIPDSLRAKVFDPFFTTKSVGKGTGQGLAIAHDVIVQRHGGSIDIESRAGTGTTFIVRLPLQPAAGKAA